jgi:hypothetical protein
MPGAAIDSEHVTSVAEARCGIGDIVTDVERVERPRLAADALGEDRP